jgi:hypothetical protein
MPRPGQPWRCAEPEVEPRQDRQRFTGLPAQCGPQQQAALLEHTLRQVITATHGQALMQSLFLLCQATRQIGVARQLGAEGLLLRRRQTAVEVGQNSISHPVLSHAQDSM